MTEPVIPQPLAKAEIIDLLAKGACILRDRHGAAVIHVEGRCADDWEDLLREGWLQQTTAGTFVLSDHGIKAVARLEIGGKL
jgi:hypothetical protein